MARLGSRASVLAALEPADAGPTAEPPGTQQGTTGSRPGREIWQNARQQAEFHVAYAEMLEADRRPRDVSEAWVQELYPPGRWVGPAALATSYRMAAQHAALVDAAWATKLAVRAGMAYVAAGLPFGLFLLTGLLDDQTLRDSAAVRDVVEPFRTPDAAHHPVQLTYLLLAAASRPWLRDPLEQTLSGAERRLSSHSRSPIGPQGVPIGEYVGLANAMGFDDGPVGPRSGPGSVRDVATRLAGLHRAQAASLRAAQRNRYLWERGASPVSVVDLEHVAMSGLALRRRPWFDELSAAVTAELATDDELAQLPIWTIESIETELPTIAPSVTGIMREPDRAWRTSDFREPEREPDPWEREPERPTGRTRVDETRADYPDSGDDASTTRFRRRPEPPARGELPPAYGGLDAAAGELLPAYNDPDAAAGEAPPAYGGPDAAAGEAPPAYGEDDEDGGDGPDYAN